jgi:hypothetical protein
MIRQPEREQLNRLAVKTLDQVFIMKAKEGLSCSLFEAEALTDLVKEVYFPWLSRPEAIQSGQLVLTAVSAEEPGHKPLKHCKMVPVVLTLYSGGEDHEYRLEQNGKQGVTALRRQQIQRMAQEALDQGALLTAEDFAFRIFNCGLRTISRDLQALSEQGIVVPLRSQQKDAGRALSHRVQAVELYLKRYTFTQIQKRIYHSLHSIANYVTSFTIVVAHTRDGHTVDEIAFLMQISPSLVKAYQELYEQYNTPEYRERLAEIVVIVKARDFHPDQLAKASQAKKGGPKPS